MELRYLCCVLVVIFASVTEAMWNNLNCPAPRAPNNGLSFIFRNGELVHFRCHPGYLMRGKPVAYCVNSVWTESSPECIPIKKWNPQSAQDDSATYHHQSRTHAKRHHDVANDAKLDKQRDLFNWGDDPSSPKKQSVYGDGPRRLPLINGIWPSQDHAEQVLALGPQSTPGPKTLVKEEVAIAELRHQQLEELKKQRHVDGEFRGRRKKGQKKKRKNSVLVDETAPRETVISLGNTEDGDALSIALAKPSNDTDKASRHRYRHRDGRKKKRRGKGKKQKPQPTYPSYIIARSSRVDTSGISPYHTGYQFNRQPSQPAGRTGNELVELRRPPVERVKKHNESLEVFDTSCVESLYGREVPMIAPQVAHAFVYRYETKKNEEFPFNGYMEVKYRCLSGYSFANAHAQTLNCRHASWVGEVPRCV